MRISESLRGIVFTVFDYLLTLFPTKEGSRGGNMATLSKLAQDKTWLGLIKVFAGIITSEKKGKGLITVWGTFIFTSLVILPIFNIRKRAQRKAELAADGKKRSIPINKEALSKLLVVLKKHILTRHGLYLATYILTLCTRILITVKLADQGGILGSYMGSKNWKQMFLGQVDLGLWFMAGAVATASMKFLEKRVVLSTRGILYKELLSHYLNENNLYYHSARKVDDAPSRLTADLEEFTSSAVRTLGHILKPSIDIIHLSIVIAGRIGFAGLAGFLSFFVISQKMLQGVLNALPRSLKQISIRKQELEAELRSHHSQLHNYREQIALQDGTDTERETLEKRFKKLHNHQLLTACTYFVVDVLNTYVLKYGGAMCGFSVLIPAVYFSDDKTPPHKLTAGYLSNSALLQTLATEIKDLVEALTEIPRVKGLATRVSDLTDAMSAAKKEVLASKFVKYSKDAEDGIEVGKLTIIPPGNPENPNPEPLVSDLDISIKRGEHTVIRGANGIGKSSFFRTLCGLWNPHSVETLVMPPKDSFFVVSQDCYFPADFSLAEQICYPSKTSLVGEEGTELGEKLLKSVGLEDFTSKLHSVGDWRNRLSGGQKQRLSWARMLFHKPVYALIDEGTSAVDAAGCQLLHTQALESNITLVSISHHENVDRNHLRTLDFYAGGHKISE